MYLCANYCDMSKNIFASLSVFCFLLIFTSSLLAQVVQRPKIGLVLSGGGAKGLAHIGALKVLTEAGIYPDYITGTSMGSIVGGLYAIGYSLEELEDLAIKLDWDNYFNDALERKYLPIEERGTADFYQLTFPVEKGKVELPKGLVRGQKINLLLSRITARSHGVESFDDFPIPFRCVATDFETGDAAVLTKGSLGDAIRASMSIPSAFEPFDLDGRLLIDGMAVRNLPVEDVKAMGADIIIAVDVGGPLYTKEDISSLIVVMDQTSSYRIVESVNWQSKFADIVIKPNLEGLSVLSFDQADTLIQRGWQATKDSLERVLTILDGERGGKPTSILEQVEIIQLDTVEVVGVDERGEALIRKLLQFKIGEEYTMEEVESRFQKLLGSRFVKDVRYRVIPVGLDYKLVIYATPQSGNFIKVGMNYDSHVKAGFLFNATLSNWLLNGSKLSLDLKISEFPAFQGRYMIYTATRPNIGLRVDGHLQFYPGFYYGEGEALNEFDLNHFETKLELFSAPNNRWLLSLGGGWERYSQDAVFFNPLSQSLRLRQSNIYGSIIRDNYDRLHFPHRGSQLSITGKWSIDSRLRRIVNRASSTIPASNRLVRFQYRKLIPMGKKIALHWYNDAGWQMATENNIFNMFVLGRRLHGEITHIPFYGLDYMEVPASRYAITGLKFRFEPALDYFASLAFNYAYYESDAFSFTQEEGDVEVSASSGHIYGVGLELGVFTRLGPAWLSGEYDLDRQDFNFALHLGYFF